MASIEHNLFIEWIDWLKSNHPEHGFMYDGIISQSDWELAEKHILFVLKDYNAKGNSVSLDKVDINDREDIKRKIFNLRYYLQKGINEPKNWRVWDNVSRWTYGLLHLTIDSFPSYREVDAQGNANHRSSNLKKVSVLDLKKEPGTARCSKQQLNQYLRKYPQNQLFTSRQIELYGEIDYVVCCGDGVYDAFLQTIQQGKLKDSYENLINRPNYCITKQGTIIIKYIHPLLLHKKYCKESAYSDLMKIAQNALLDKVKLIT